MPRSLGGSTIATIVLAVWASLIYLYLTRLDGYVRRPATKRPAVLRVLPKPLQLGPLREFYGHELSGPEILFARLFRRRRRDAETGEDVIVSEEEEEETPDEAEAEKREQAAPADAESGHTEADEAVEAAVEEAGPEAEEPGPEADEAESPAAQPEPQVVSTHRPGLDHVPFAPDEVEAEEAEERRRLRDRVRRGFRKTRDYLNRDVREVFGSGPIQESFDSIEEILVRADVGIGTATALTEELRTRGRELTSDTLGPALRDSLREMLRDADRRLRVNTEGPSVWLVVGVNGTGKTTSVAKLAALAKARGFAVLVAAADTFRAAAIEQLETWAERVGVDIIKQHQGADPAAVVFDAIARARARGYDLVIADTAGRLHNRKPLMDELSKVRRVIDREGALCTECLLLLDATTGQNGLSQARAFAEAVEVTGLVLSRLDATAKGGIAVAVERDLKIPVKAVGVGEKAEDLAPFDPDAFVGALFGQDT